VGRRSELEFDRIYGKAVVARLKVGIDFVETLFPIRILPSCTRVDRFGRVEHFSIGSHRQANRWFIDHQTDASEAVWSAGMNLQQPKMEPAIGFYCATNL
jgi:hypothetical protein